MKTLKFLVLITILSFLNEIGRAQSTYEFKEFMRTQGYKIVAAWAHPTSTFVDGSIDLDDRTVRLKINYTTAGDNSCTTVFDFYLNYAGLIGSIDIVSDDDWFPAFQAATNIKNWIDENLQEREKDEVVSKLENYLRKTYYNFDGKDLCLVILNVNWIDYY